ncbi:MAG TPA: hypothetical protein VLC94_08365 [Candidatus Acidoferrum sp.]|nr:hypothetical protein [Candidatus Acidoferrum sp.]
MTAAPATREPLPSLKELYRIYSSIAAKPGMPAPLAEFKLSQPEAEKIFSAFDEDYHISRFFHFQNVQGHEYSINGEIATHVAIDPEIKTVL